MEAFQYFIGETLLGHNQTDYLLAMLLCAEMFLNCSILQANGKESQKELHAVRATVNALLMDGAKAKRERERENAE